MTAPQHRTRLLAALLGLLAAGTSVAAPVFTDNAEAELHARSTHAVPGESFRVALRLRPQPGWHTYWRNPGDSGLPTQIDWQLPEGVTASDIQWQPPGTYRLADVVNYGYGEQTLHIVDMQLPADWPPGQALHLDAEAEWLICSDICVPESASLSLELPTATEPAEPNPVWAPDFEAAEASLPEAVDWPASMVRVDETIRLQLQLSSDLSAPEGFTAFPITEDFIHHSAPQQLQRRGDTLWLTQPQSPYFETMPEASRWVLVAHDGNGGTRAVRLEAVAGEVPAPPEGAENVASGKYDAPGASASPEGSEAPTSDAREPNTDKTGLPAMLVAAFLGGLILNLMPCVFPVLAIKALGIVSAQGESRAHQRLHGLVYTAGVVLSCLAAAGLLLGLRAGGEALGWGFQLQSPIFVGALAYLFFAFGLSLSGVFTLGTRIMGLGQGLTQQQGLGGSFATGVLAVVVASPCTAPLMGAALGFAVTQPTGVALAVFAMLGLGLASPFLLMGLFPTLARWLPRPGAWMEHFKQAMAFPLYLSVVWLLWVLSRQAGSEALAAVLTGMVLIAFAAWLWHRPQKTLLALRIAALLGAAALLALPVMRPPTERAAASGTTENAWSPERVAELRAEGRTVFVNFTADWCITCLANERSVLSRDAVQQAFAREDVRYLKADWTRSDPLITEALGGFGRNGVPLYVVYRDGGDPEVLPQLLTRDIVLGALGEP